LITRKTQLFAKRLKQKTLCHYNYKCKSRADVVFSQKEQGRFPSDIGLCETHARELLESLIKLYGKKAVSVSEEELINAVETIRAANKRIDKLEYVINAVLDSKYDQNRHLSMKVTEGLLAEEGLAWNERPNIKESLKMYLEYQKPEKLKMREQAEIDIDNETATIDLVALGIDTDFDLDTLLAEAEKAEGKEETTYTEEEGE